MNNYKLRVGISDLDRNSRQRTIHIYKEGSPLYFFVNLNPLNNEGIVYHICIDKELYSAYMVLPKGSEGSTLNIAIHTLCTAQEEIRVALEVIEKLNTYMDSTAKHFVKILDELVNKAIFETN